jgi:hypothetical protein
MRRAGLLGEGTVGFLRRERDQCGEILRPVLGVEVSAVDVLRDDVGSRFLIILTGRLPETIRMRGWKLPEPFKGAIAIAAVQNPALVYNHLLTQAVLFDVGDQLLELGPLHQREDVSERVKLEGLGHDASPSASR